MQDRLSSVNVLHARLAMMGASTDVPTWRTTVTSTLRPNRINIDLQNYKQLWLDYCKAHGTTPSAAFRLIVAKLTSKGVLLPALVEAEGKAKKRRVGVRLTKAEIAKAGAIAQREGFSPSRWIVALINARLDGTPQLGQRELETLARLNMQMLAIGRNLNQLAKAANAGVSITRPGGADIIEASLCCYATCCTCCRRDAREC